MNPNPTSSEANRYVHLVKKYLKGIGIDIGSQGSPVVPHAWQLDLPQEEFLKYNGGFHPRGPIQLRGYAQNLPVDSESLDFVFSSHLIEDFEDWNPLLSEWVRVLKHGGYLVILLPDRELFLAALAAGQPPNDAHRHESHEGELTTYSERYGLEVIEDRLTKCFPTDYNIMFVAKRKPAA